MAAGGAGFGRAGMTGVGQLPPHTISTLKAEFNRQVGAMADGLKGETLAVDGFGAIKARGLNVEARAAKAESAKARHGINTHEAAGGHTIEQHIKKSDVELKERLANEPKEKVKAASSFYSEAIANRVQMKFVATHKQEIAEWLKTGEYKLVGKIQMDEPVGKVVGRAKRSAAVETNKATVVLLRNDSPQGYYIRTSYPSR